jgi:hypothetical protein
MNPQIPLPAHPAAPSPFHVHGHSMRIGIKLGVIACNVPMPTDAMVEEVIRSRKPPHITVDDFAIETLLQAAHARMERRRSVALSILVPMIQRSLGDGPIKQSDMQRMVETAWSGARVFEEQDNATASIDTLDSSMTAPGG